MMDLDIIPTAAMLFPGPVPIELGGNRYRATELRVRHVGQIERRAALVFDHPFTGMEAHLEAVDALPANAEGREEPLSALWDAADCWPPRLGSRPYYHALATVGVAPLYLRLVLRNHRPRIGARDALEMVRALDPAEWLALDGIAHGIAPRSGEGDAGGFDWRCAVRYLTHPEHGRMTISAIGDLYLSQLYFLCSADPSYQVRLPDRPMGVASPCDSI